MSFHVGAAPRNTMPVGLGANVRAARFLAHGARWIFMLILAILFATPLLWMLATSLKSETDLSTNTLSLIPQHFLWSNYATAFHDIRPFLWNSVKLAVINVAGVLVISSIAAYAFARLEFAGRDIAFFVVLATAIIPGIVLLIPQYIIFQRIGWVDTQIPLWLPRVMTPVFGTFLLRQAFMGLPRELDDAAKIDGVSLFGIYWRILLPQIRPAVAAVAVFTFIESWNDLFGPLIFINSTNLATLPLALAQFSDQYFSTITLLMAASAISILPVIIVFLIAQRYFVQGIAASGLR